MSFPLLAATVVLYGLVAVDLWQRGIFTSMWWTGGAFFFYACANACLAMATRQ